ncbi:peptide ABC transporter substrate-binding protein [Salinithrix halophila]|uniref:Peptide ABC transporter substrate-binding protein n=1 Tax=Salinithrix halophila TaxID=1485204 RepID=A0ABV8JI19_9BACL
MKKRFCAWTACLFLMATLLTACSNPFGEAKDGSGDKQVLNLVENSEPVNLDTARLIDDSSVKIMNNVMEGLMRLDQDNQPQPAMAKGLPEISSDRRTYTFKIREAEWSDGKPVRAQDFEYAWKRALDPKIQSEYAYILYPLLNAEKYNKGEVGADEVGVKALNDHTLQVRLEKPIPYFLSLTAFITYLPQRQDIVEKYGDQYAKEDENMVFNGPFKLAEWTHENSYRYKKNDRYWDRDRVSLDTINVQIVQDHSTAISLYQANKADVVALDSQLVGAFENSKEFVRVDSGTVYFLRYNTVNDFLSNADIRRAISMAVDREELVDKVLKDDTPAGGMVPPPIRGYGGRLFRDQTEEKVKYDPEKAKELLEKGMDDLGIDTMPTIDLLTYNDDRKKVAVLIQEQLKRILGLNVRIDPQPQKQKFELEKAGNFQLSLVRWTGDYDDPMTFLDMWHSNNPINFGHWKNTEFDSLIDRSKDTVDYRQREVNLIKAEKLLVDDAGVAPLYYERESYLHKPRVKNLYRHPVLAKYSLKWVSIQKKKEKK